MMDKKKMAKKGMMGMMGMPMSKASVGKKMPAKKSMGMKMKKGGKS
jgi:hypothetical protein